jgi:uncharacterized RDD family membrane protein YckC
MSDERQIIDAYTAKVARHLSGQARDRARAELSEHLADAAEAGELPDALVRLGTPQEAAATFAELPSAPLAPIATRFTAVLIDNLPLVGVTVALLIQGLTRAVTEGQGFALAFPPFVYFKIGESCVSFAPTQCGVDAYEGAGLLYTWGVPLALLWSIVGLGLLEASTGVTPGKRAMNLRVVTETGLRIRPVTGVVRRLSLLVGPFAWLDWIPVLWGDRRRVLDRLTETKVVSVSRSAAAK